jgi:hypothetical protein
MSNAAFVLKPIDLLRGLQRNFNGIEVKDFERLVHRFFKNVSERMEDGHLWQVPTNLNTDTFVELIEDRLANVILTPPPFRLILLIA